MLRVLSILNVKHRPLSVRNNWNMSQSTFRPSQAQPWNILLFSNAILFICSIITLFCFTSISFTANHSRKYVWHIWRSALMPFFLKQFKKNCPSSFELCHWQFDIKCWSVINSFVVTFAREFGHFSLYFSIKFVKLNLFDATRAGGQIVTAGNGIEPIDEILSSYITVTGYFARFTQRSMMK